MSASLLKVSNLWEATKDVSSTGPSQLRGGRRVLAADVSGATAGGRCVRVLGEIMLHGAVGRSDAACGREGFCF